VQLNSALIQIVRDGDPVEINKSGHWMHTYRPTDAKSSSSANLVKPGPILVRVDRGDFTYRKKYRTCTLTDGCGKFAVQLKYNTIFCPRSTETRLAALCVRRICTNRQRLNTERSTLLLQLLRANLADFALCCCDWPV
jgi:hypothetical protein